MAVGDRLVAAAAVVLGCWPSASAKVIDGRIRGSTVHHDLIYLGKFCFQCSEECDGESGDTGHDDWAFARSSFLEFGSMRIEAHELNAPGLNISLHQNIAVYRSRDVSDDSRSWRNIYKADMPCEEKLQRAWRVFPLETASLMAARLDQVVAGKVDAREFVELAGRPQFFHFAAVNCHESMLNMAYTLTLRNPGNSHLSYDDMGLFRLELWMCGAAERRGVRFPGGMVALTPEPPPAAAGCSSRPSSGCSLRATWRRSPSNRSAIHLW